MFRCSCLCGDVKFEIKANPNHAINCHCRYCRKSHGAPYVTVLVVLNENFEITHGLEKLTRMPSDLSKTGRYSCSTCGSKLYTETEPGRPITVHTSALENEEVVSIMAHTNVESKCPCVKIEDGLPKFSGNITKEEYMELVD